MPSALEPAGDFAGVLPRALRVVGSLCVIVLAYWLYSWTVVPLIEPPAEGPETSAVLSPITPPEQVGSRWKDFKVLFHEGDWQLKEPKVLDNDNGRTRLLFQNYQNHGNGCITINPCCIVHIPDGASASPQERLNRAIIMEAPEGATLQFDRPFQPSGAEIGHLQSGELLGRVTIRSKGRSTGPEDELRIVTQNIKLKGRDVWTLDPIDFRMGASYGRGQDMHIRFLPSEEGGSSGAGLNLGALEKFELRHLDRLHIEKAKTATVPSTAKPATPAASASPTDRLGGDVPAEVSCRGPFRFFMDRQAATFEDQVSVLGINPEGPCDQLTCDVLTIFFVDGRVPPPKGPKGKATAVKGPPGLTDLVARRLDAVGNPVIVNSPRRDTQARAQHLEYDLKSESVVLTSPDESWLRQGPVGAVNEIHAPRLQYDPAAEPGRMGRAVADGPGWFRGVMSGKAATPQTNPPQSLAAYPPQPAPQSSPPAPPRPIEARWAQQMFIRPQGEFQVLSLTGGALLASEETGRLEGREIHFWLKELLPQTPNGQSKLEPDHMLAVGNVWLEAKQLSARVEHMEVWFERRVAARGGANPPERQRRLEQLPAGSPPRTTDARGPERQWHLTALHLSAEDVSLTPLQNQIAPAPAQGQAPVTAPESHYEVTGRVLRAVMLLPDQGDSSAGGEAELAEVVVEENVMLVETQTAKPGDKRLLVTGDRLHAIAPKSPQGIIEVVGRPAHFEARGLTLAGGNINLNRGTNRLWVDGPGLMTVPMQGNFRGETRPQTPLPAQGGTVEIRWRDSMTFDGRDARFEGSATAATASGNLQTETLEVRFLRRISFAEEKQSQEQTKIEKILCRGGVRMENRKMEGQKLVSIQRMQAAHLTVNEISGALEAGGPGWLSQVSRGSADPMVGSGGPGRAVAPPRRPAPANADELTGLVVRFSRSLTGNMQREHSEYIFDDDVRSAYAPVTDWNAILDPDHPELLGPRGAALCCRRQLTIRQTPALSDGSRPLEVLAEGNVKIESQTYTAGCDHASYDQAKDLLILEGDGRTGAELFRQYTIGGETTKTTAQRILYWPHTDHVKADNIGSLDLRQFPAGPPGKR